MYTNWAVASKTALLHSGCWKKGAADRQAPFFI